MINIVTEMANGMFDSYLDEFFDPKVCSVAKLQARHMLTIQIHLVPNASATSTFTLLDLGISNREGSTPIAGSDPFPFLTHEGVEAYRRAIFQQNVKVGCTRRMGKGTLLLRNVASQSKFVRDFWKHPETMTVVNRALGVDLEVVSDFEIGHTNIQLAKEDSAVDDLSVKPLEVLMTEEEKSYDPLSADSVVPWQYVNVVFR